MLGAEAFKLLLLLRLGKLVGLRLQGEHWLLIGILGGLPPTLHLLRVQTPLTAVGAELSGVQASGLEHHCELVGSAPCNRQAFLQL